VVGADHVFLEQRRKGLQRFLSFISNHETLSRDEYVIQFLTFRDTMQQFRSSHDIVDEEEWVNFRFSEQVKAKIPHDFEERLVSLRQTLDEQYQSFCQIILVTERYIQRLLGILLLILIPKKTCNCSKVL
jgi:sorting nexin-8